MTPEQLQQFREWLKLNKFAPDRSDIEMYPYQRGWNAMIEAVELWVKQSEASR